MNKKLIFTLTTLVLLSLFTINLASAYSYGNNYYKKTTSYEINSEPYYFQGGHGKRTITTKTTVKDYGRSYAPSYGNNYYHNNHYPTTNWRYNQGYNYHDYKNPYHYNTDYHKPYYYSPRYDPRGYYNWRY
jgi:hypothetical protein